MDAKMFRETYLHPSLLENFLNKDDATGEESYPIVDNLFSQAQTEATNFVAGIPSDIRYMFDTNTYLVKRAVVNIYNWILQNKAELTSLNLEGLDLNDQEVFDHFKALKDDEEKDLNQMREAMMDYIKSLKMSNNPALLGGQPIAQGARMTFGVARNRYTGRYC